jgi:hypothetical protein
VWCVERQKMLSRFSVAHGIGKLFSNGSVHKRDFYASGRVRVGFIRAYRS